MNVGVKNAESISSLDSDLSCADISMYCAKENNKLIVKYKPELKINYMKKVDRSVDFFEALENDDFMFYFQPVYKSDNSIDSLELFIRWNFQGEIVSSKELYNMIEGANKKEMLDSYVVKKACNFVHDNNFKVRINIDHISIMYNNDELINYLEETVISFGIDKKNIILEFGFDEMIDDVLLFKEKIENIRKLGFKVSISEKSNSYILLPYLYLIDFDEVKISEYLIDNSLTSIKIRFLLDNILKYIKMSNSDLVFAEISKESTYRFVRALNLDCYYQGYYLAEPNSYEKIAKKLLK